MSRQLHLGLFIYPGGHHIAGWRHPSTPVETVASFDYYKSAATLAEFGKFDLFFAGDTLSVRERNGRFFGRQATPTPDPLSMLSALSTVTQKIGLVGTLSTTYHEPAAVASKFATLDHLSLGRAAWNVVTTFDDKAALNFNLDSAMDKSDRYARAQEFVDVCTGLWDSADDETSRQPQTPGGQGAFAHQGKSFDVRGSPGMPRPPQGWPVLVQAGQSVPSRSFAALVAEAIFTTQTDMNEAIVFRSSTHERMAEFRRSPDELVVMPGLSPLLASTELEARALEEELADLVHPELGVWMLVDSFGFPLQDRDLADLLPIDEIRTANRGTADAVMFLEKADRQKMTIGEAARTIARSRVHHSFVGTPEKLADLMQRWFREGACDGFNIMPPFFPNQLAIFVQEVVPVLQSRGLFRKEYEGDTLREHLGLKRPSVGKFQGMLHR